MSYNKKILLYLWQLPQNLLGLVIKRKSQKEQYLIDGDVVDVYYNDFPAGISLGQYIIMNKRLYDNERLIRHEHGHQTQSLIWGPLYLLTVGVPSAARYWIGVKDYYGHYPENQADKFGGVYHMFKKL